MTFAGVSFFFHAAHFSVTTSPLLLLGKRVEIGRRKLGLFVPPYIVHLAMFDQSRADNIIINREGSQESESSSIDT